MQLMWFRCSTAYESQGRQAFDAQELIQVWMVHHFQQLIHYRQKD